MRYILPHSRKSHLYLSFFFMHGSQTNNVAFSQPCKPVQEIVSPSLRLNFSLVLLPPPSHDGSRKRFRRNGRRILLVHLEHLRLINPSLTPTAFFDPPKTLLLRFFLAKKHGSYLEKKVLAGCIIRIRKRIQHKPKRSPSFQREERGVGGKVTSGSCQDDTTRSRKERKGHGILQGDWALEPELHHCQHSLGKAGGGRIGFRCQRVGGMGRGKGGLGRLESRSSPAWGFRVAYSRSTFPPLLLLRPESPASRGCLGLRDERPL